jgi:hypothetical protein
MTISAPMNLGRNGLCFDKSTGSDGQLLIRFPIHNYAYRVPSSIPNVAPGFLA